MPNSRKSCAFRLAIAAGATIGLIPPLAAQAPAPTITYESAQYRYAVKLPTGCRHDEGPGTIDAVCSADLDSDKSASAPAALSLVLEVTVERTPGDATLSGEALAGSFKDSDFRDELPESVCGAADKARVKIEDVKQSAAAASVTFSAIVTCPEMRFVGVTERQARVLYVITPGLRYRLFARAPAEQFEQNKPIIDAFLASFHTLPPNN